MGLVAHFLEAEGTLEPWRTRLLADVATMDALFRRTLGPSNMPNVDVVIARIPGSGIPGVGMGGHSFRRGAMMIQLDPDDRSFLKSFEKGEFKRIAAHEFHHCLRHAGIGYGKTLGEAMVSEGLADYFVMEVLGGDPPIWSTALATNDWQFVLQGAGKELHSRAYNHFQWFYGTDSVWPAWAGYTVGFHVVEHYLAAHPGLLPSRMANTSAQSILAHAWPLIVAARAEMSGTQDIKNK